MRYSRRTKNHKFLPWVWKTNFMTIHKYLLWVWRTNFMTIHKYLLWVWRTYFMNSFLIRKYLKQEMTAKWNSFIHKFLMRLEYGRPIFIFHFPENISFVNYYVKYEQDNLWLEILHFVHRKYSIHKFFRWIWMQNFIFHFRGHAQLLERHPSPSRHVTPFSPSFFTFYLLI